MCMGPIKFNFGLSVDWDIKDFKNAEPTLFFDMAFNAIKKVKDVFGKFGNIIVRSWYTSHKCDKFRYSIDEVIEQGENRNDLDKFVRQYVYTRKYVANCKYDNCSEIKLFPMVFLTDFVIPDVCVPIPIVSDVGRWIARQIRDNFDNKGIIVMVEIETFKDSYYYF